MNFINKKESKIKNLLNQNLSFPKLWRKEHDDEFFSYRLQLTRMSSID